jgi:hypothetical protein
VTCFFLFHHCCPWQWSFLSLQHYVLLGKLIVFPPLCM